MGFIGSTVGSALGNIGSSLLPIPGINGSDFGRFLGGFLPFKKGGLVKKPTTQPVQYKALLLKKGGRVVKLKKFQKNKKK